MTLCLILLLLIVCLIYYHKHLSCIFFVGLRLLGIGRNEYIEIMNKSRTNRGRLFGKRNVRGLLPRVPCSIHIEPWWRVEIGLVLEDDVKV